MNQVEIPVTNLFKMYVKPNKGAWDISRGNYQFKKSGTLDSWAIISLDDRSRHTIKDFVGEMQHHARGLGFHISHPKKAYEAYRTNDVSLSERFSFLKYF
jgi:hypothetical protein